MRRDYTLSATPRPPSLPPLNSGRQAPKLRALHTGAATFAMVSFGLGLPLLVCLPLDMPLLVGLVAWVANAVVAALLTATAPPSEYHPPLRAGSRSYEPGGIGAYYAYQDFRHGGGDCGGY